MSNNDRSTSQRFLPHSIRTFLWGQATEQPPNPTANQQEQASLNPPEAVPPTHLPTHDHSDARSDSSMPDLLSDNWSDSDSSQDARDVEMDIAPDDHDDSWIDEDEMPPHRSTVPVDQPQTTDHRARVEDEVEPPTPSQSNPTPNPAPRPPPQAGLGVPPPFPTLPPWNFGLGTARIPGRPFPFFPNPTGSSGNGTNATPRRDDIPANPQPQSTQPPQHPQPDRNPVPENARQDPQGVRFHAHTFVLGMDGTARAVPFSPAALSELFSHIMPGIPQPQTQPPQPDQPPDQQDEDRDRPAQPDNAGQPPFLDFVVGGIGTIPPLFAAPGPEPQPDPGNRGAPEPGHGAPGWIELIRAMFAGEPPEEKEDPERAKKLVRGLERVPVGLVKRMIRVDGVPGGHEDLAGTDGCEAPGCAICWDSLLPEEPSEDAELHSDSTTPLKSEHPIEGSDPNHAVSDSATDDDSPTAIICLPCSHVFHASCLIPWFSKPRHTTCPTCRFDVDPRNLTYTPPSRRPRTAPATTTNPAPPNDAQPQPAPDPATAATNAPPPPPTAHNHEHPPQPGPRVERDHQPQGHIHVAPPIFFQDFLPVQPQQGPNPPPGETHDEAPNNRHDTPPLFGFGFGPLQPPVFGPPPSPGHPTHGGRATAANVPNDLGGVPHPDTGFQPFPIPDFSRGVGLTVDFTFPPELDQERVSQAVRDQATAFLRLFTGGGRGPGTGQPGPGGANRESQGPREWIPPPAPGPTLRQRVETRERNAGLRCDDPSCGIGPSDEDPFPEVFNDPDSPSIERIKILKDGGDEAVCKHVLHPACLVSADRCAGWGEKDRPSQDGDGEYEVVSCPVCRSVGKVQAKVWEEGAKALLV